MAKPVIYFHVGYARAESTFLQKMVFPALDGLQYIQHRNFRALASAKDRFKGEKVLISHEADGNIFDRCDKAWETFGSQIVISVRRHDILAESAYRIDVKNGHTYRFPDFLDIKDDQGVRKIKDWTYLNILEYAEKLTGKKPLLLIFEDYINDPGFYLDTLCAYLGCDIDRAKLGHMPPHNIYSDKQLRLRRQFSQRYLSPKASKKRLINNSLESLTKWEKLKRKFIVSTSKVFMLVARLLPASLLDDEPLIDEQHSQPLRDFFAPDWAACFEFVEQQSMRLNVARNKEVTWN